ncbi:MAG TPA: hypothetical protein VG796_22185 [Verrucomicrobiales bacterium]|jgi:hypothetical protein|nr:hypothetical protein [Verrucomicrobiales bacterium]
MNHGSKLLFAPLVFLLSSTACNTVNTYAGRADDPRTPGVLRGQLYYLPRGQIQLKGVLDDKTKVFTVTVTATTVADPKYRYYLDTGTNVLFDDDYKLYVSPKGLLDTVNVTTTDKTATILGDLASIAASAMKFNAGVTGGKADAAHPPPGPEPFDYTFTLDELDKIRRLVRDRGFDLSIQRQEPTGAGFETYEFPAPKTAFEAAHGRGEAHGVVFRPTVPYKVTLTDGPLQERIKRWRAEVGKLDKAAVESAQAGDALKLAKAALADASKPKSDEQAAVDKAQTKATDAQKDLDQKTLAIDALARAGYKSKAEQGDSAVITRVQGTAIIPDPDTQLLLPLGRSAFVTRTDNIVFTDGLLAKVERNRPSPIVGFLQIPKNILTSLVPLPLELKQTRINNINAQNQLDKLANPATP